MRIRCQQLKSSWTNNRRMRFQRSCQAKIKSSRYWFVIRNPLYWHTGMAKKQNMYSITKHLLIAVTFVPNLLSIEMIGFSIIINVDFCCCTMHLYHARCSVCQLFLCQDWFTEFIYVCKICSFVCACHTFGIYSKLMHRLLIKRCFTNEANIFLFGCLF